MIYCCGEALIDMIPLATPEGTAFLPVCGGAAWNTAVALGRLGARTGLVAGLSSDGFGQRLTAEAEAAGVDVSASVRLDLPTALAIVTLDAEGGPQFSIRDQGSAGRSLSPEALPASLPGARAALFGGISLATEPSGSSFEALMTRLPDDVLRILDPNIRPRLIEDAAALRARLARLSALCDVIKLSSEDLDWLSPDPASFIADLLQGRTLMVYETLGAEGLRLHRPSETQSFPARAVEVVDTVGAGDTFNAGLLAGLQQAGLLSRAALAEVATEALRPAITLGLDAAALSVTRKGANPPTLAELRIFTARARTGFSF